MLSVEDWPEIRCLHYAEGMPITVIARAMRCSKNCEGGGPQRSRTEVRAAIAGVGGR